LLKDTNSGKCVYHLFFRLSNDEVANGGVQEFFLKTIALQEFSARSSAAHARGRPKPTMELSLSDSVHVTPVDEKFVPSNVPSSEGENTYHLYFHTGRGEAENAAFLLHGLAADANLGFVSQDP
jgi:hypothetical protein